jgi:hypothetical protein
MTDTNGKSSAPQDETAAQSTARDFRLPDGAVALRRYLARISATEQENPRRWIISKEDGYGYSKTIAKIELSIEGVITCDNASFAPTENEAEAIKKEHNPDIYPKSIHMTDAKFEWLKKHHSVNLSPKDIDIGAKEIWYKFYDRRAKDGNNILMVKQRIERPGVKKTFRFWTMFDKVGILQCKPDGLSPMYKPEKLISVYIMIHESEKTAAYCNKLVSKEGTPKQLAARRLHPWYDFLSKYEHWAIGGAHNGSHVNWKELHDVEHSEVVYVQDNDHPGRSATKDVSRGYGGRMKCLMFDSRFDEGFDLANDFRKMKNKEAFWFTNEEGVTFYRGPSPRELLFPCTWATKLIPNPNGKGQPKAVLLDDFKIEWHHCILPEVFVHIDRPERQYTEKEFNNLMRPFSHVANLAALMKEDLTGKVEKLRYLPDRAPGFYVDGRERYINTFVPCLIVAREMTDREEALWNQFWAALIDDLDDLRETQRWCATLIDRPDIRMLYGLLLISERQGIGKTTLGERILVPLLGPWNVSFPTEKDVIDSEFNKWMVHKRLALINEILAGDGKKLYNNLKSVLTDKHVEANDKYIARYNIEVCLTVFACSNQLNAIKMACEDRRWLVPKCVEKKQPDGFWKRFYQWLEHEDGLAAIKGWAGRFLKDEAHGPVQTGVDAPSTARKRKMIEASRSIEEQAVIDVLDDLRSLKLDGEIGERNRKRLGMTSDQPLFVLDATIVEYVNFRLYSDAKPARGGRGLTELKVRTLCGQLPKPDGKDDNGWRITTDRECWTFYEQLENGEWKKGEEGKRLVMETRRGHLLSTSASEEFSVKKARENCWAALTLEQIKNIIKKLGPPFGVSEQ